MNITVMLGGPSAEREVSLRSGAAVAKALRSLGHEVHELDPRNGSWSLPPDTDVVFLALHGTYGEDGTVQRRLDELGALYTGCDDFGKVVKSCPVPLVIAGGPKLKTELDALKLAHSAISEGAKGVDMGRNIWQSDNAVGMMKAIRKIVHEGASVKDAAKLIR